MPLLSQRVEAQRTRLLVKECVLDQLRVYVFDNVDEREQGVPGPEPARAIHVEILAVQQQREGVCGGQCRAAGETTHLAWSSSRPSGVLLAREILLSSDSTPYGPPGRCIVSWMIRLHCFLCLRSSVIWLIRATRASFSALSARSLLSSMNSEMALSCTSDKHERMKGHSRRCGGTRTAGGNFDIVSSACLRLAGLYPLIQPRPTLLMALTVSAAGKGRSIEEVGRSSSTELARLQGVGYNISNSCINRLPLPADHPRNSPPTTTKT